ncbi:MAG TPA: Do family serine endopeptidase [Candidatus Fermentibacter daniensis]|nr:Do family serine endopeptidase [Candidatus Fermentibacter daniensis]HQM40712.1 Do family serine endopeptidase [Candidatus Fermentibacter daniensis]
MSRFSGITSAIMLLAAAACRGQPGLEQAAPVYVDTVRVEVPVADPEALSAAFCEIASSAGPSVVTITSRSVVKAVVPGFQTIPSPFGFDPWGGGFRFPGFEEREYVREGLGSGVIIDSKGYIVTNNHVVAGADELEVILADGARFPASLVGTDPRTDLAVIRIEAGDTPLQAIRQGDASSLRVGQIVLAVGSPFALSSSVTQGIISFIGRTGVGLADYEDFIQTDAAINPGNSGGALVNLAGELVGINTAIASRTGGYDGIGFAIPIDIVASVTSELVARGFVSRGWLGVIIQDNTGAFRAEFGEEYGVIVSEVTPGGPAERAGILTGDVIVEIDGIPVQSVASFRNTVAGINPGGSADLLVSRSGRRRNIRVEMGELPGDGTTARVTGRAPVAPGVGWTLRELDDRAARALGYDGSGGVLVSEIEQGGIAARSGLAQGDIVLEVDRTPVSSVDETYALISASGDSALLLVFRGGHTMFILLELG